MRHPLRLALLALLVAGAAACGEDDGDGPPGGGASAPSDSLGLSGIGGGNGGGDNGGGGLPGPGDRPVGAEGGACYGNGTCDAGLECVEGRCVAVVEVGGRLGEPCLAGGVCDPGLTCADGLCVEPDAVGGGLGEPCLAGDVCDPGLACSGGLCDWPADPPGELGGPCFGNGTCGQGLLCEDERCVRADGDTGELGAPCGDGLTPCDAGLVCREGLCREDAPAVGGQGQPCRANGRCDAGLVCEAGTCAPAPSAPPSSGPPSSGPPSSGPPSSGPPPSDPSGSASVPTEPAPSGDRPSARAGCRLTAEGPEAPFVRTLRPEPFQNVECSCEASSAAADDEVEHCDWTIEKPRGEIVSLDGTPRRSIQFFLPDVGAYSVCLSVASYEGRRSPVDDCLTIETRVDSQIMCRLTWEHAFGGWTDPLNPSAPASTSRGCGGDLDLHALPSTRGEWFSPQSVYFGARTIDWPDGERAELVEDVMFGVGPETIVIREPVPGVTYTCAAHYWSDYGWAAYEDAGGWADATMEVYVSGVLMADYTRRMPGTYAFWEAAHVTWRDPSPGSPDIRSSSTVHATVCGSDRSPASCNQRGSTFEQSPCWDR